eukprot:7130473-Alexandrium_andersonii.AAC.1
MRRVRAGPPRRIHRPSEPSARHPVRQPRGRLRHRESGAVQGQGKAPGLLALLPREAVALSLI